MLVTEFQEMDVIQIMKDTQLIMELGIDLMLQTVNYIKIYANEIVECF